MPKAQAFGLRSLPPLPPEKPKSQAQRDREAKAYWASLTEEQEIWELRKMGFFQFGEPGAPRISGEVRQRLTR